jgi:hypothetical protein
MKKEPSENKYTNIIEMMEKGNLDEVKIRYPGEICTSPSETGTSI